MKEYCAGAPVPRGTNLVVGGRYLVVGFRYPFTKVLQDEFKIGLRVKF